MLSKKLTYLEAAIAIKKAIDANPLSRKKLKEIAPDISIGRNELLQAFRLLTGTTIRRYRMERRMTAGGQLLLAGELKLKQVAIECGYVNRLNNFSRDFKDVHKLAPEYWLLQQKNNKNGDTNTKE